MMSVVVYDLYAVFSSSDNVEASLSSCEFRESVADDLRSDTERMACSESSKSVSDIVFARYLKLDAAERFAVVHYVERRITVVIEIYILCAVRAVFSKSEGNYICVYVLHEV